MAAMAALATTAISARCLGGLPPAWADRMPDDDLPAFTPKHQTVWELAGQPHDREIEFILGKVEQLQETRDGQNTEPSTVLRQAWRAQLLTDARNMLAYCLHRNPNQTHALATAAKFEFFAGDSIAAQTYAARLLAALHIDAQAPEFDDKLSKYEKSELANVLLITALQALHRDDVALAIRQLRTAAVAAQARDTFVYQLITLVLVECLQQQNQHAEVQERLRNFEPSGMQPMVVAVALDRRERNAELAELSLQRHDEMLPSLRLLGPVLAQLPHHEGIYYRALALELTGQRAAARVQWALYVSDRNAHWRARAHIHLDKLDAAVRGVR